MDAGSNIAAPAIRDAVEADLEAINAIYNLEVRTGTNTFDTVEMSLDHRRAWLAAHPGGRHPAIVATIDDAVAGWACLSPWSGRCAYARAAEVSIYVHADHRGAGVGRALLSALIARARAAGLGVLLARIVAPSPGVISPSIALHRSLGFGSIGTMRRVGEKLGRILDVELLDLHLDAPAAATRDI